MSALPNVILVAHSSGGMFTLATSELEKILKGLVLMDSSPDATWQQVFMKYMKENPIKDMEELQKNYEEAPSDELLKKITIASTPYFSTKQNEEKIIRLLEKLPFNHQTFDWAAQHFDPTYQAKWVPKNIPTLILAGDQDHITPLKLFLEKNDFNNGNIIIREIKNASHFPWIDNPDAVKNLFAEYIKRLKL